MSIITIGLNPAVDCILECPDFQVGEHQHARPIARIAAGKAVNVSRALALQDTDTIATGFMGTEELEFFHEQLLAAGPGRILCHFVEVGGKTRENISIVDPKRQVETHLRLSGFTVTPNEAAILKDKLTHDLHPGDIAVFSGSLCEGLEPEYLGELIDLCTKTGVKVALDSNGAALLQVMNRPRKVWLLKPNLEELRTLVGREIPNATSMVRDAARQLLPHADIILTSRGAAGAVLLTQTQLATPTGSSPGPELALCGKSLSPTHAQRTLGCGDYLLAGFIARYLTSNSLEEAFRWGLAFASARAFSTTTEEVELPKVRALIKDIEIKPV